MEQARAGGFNALFVQVRGRGDAFYNSSMVERSPLLAGQPASFDPLARLMEKARQRGMAVHAWVNVLLTSHFPNPSSRQRRGDAPVVGHGPAVRGARDAAEGRREPSLARAADPEVRPRRGGLLHHPFVGRGPVLPRVRGPGAASALRRRRSASRLHPLSQRGLRLVAGGPRGLPQAAGRGRPAEGARAAPRGLGPVPPERPHDPRHAPVPCGASDPPRYHRLGRRGSRRVDRRGAPFPGLARMAGQGDTRRRLPHDLHARYPALPRAGPERPSPS